jgi:hypothetical protein
MKRARHIAQCTTNRPTAHTERAAHGRGAKWLLERDGYVKITIPMPREARISPEAMAPTFDLVKNKAAA